MLPELNDWLDEFITIRRAIHAHPELAFEEHRTSDLIAAKLADYGVDHIERGLAGTGLVASIHGRNHKAAHTTASSAENAIALRADIDALPIIEETGLPYQSTIHGKMHACGHDGHIATLLMVAKYLCGNRERFSGTVHLVFQPAEEKDGGANVMIQQGLFEKFPVKSIWGWHNWPLVPTGIFLAKDGPMMAAVDDFRVTITGKGGHAAQPHNSIDPVVIGAQLVLAFQTIISRSIDPMAAAVVSTTCFHSGTVENVIEDKAELRGTIRTYDPAVQDRIHKRMQDICQGTGLACGAAIDLEIERGYPATINSPAETAIAQDVARALVGERAVVTDFNPSMGAEDFAYYLQQKPGCFVGIGTGRHADGSDPGLHDARYDFNDAVLPLAASYFIRLVEKNLPA